jgi:hypothetical protein
MAKVKGNTEARSNTTLDMDRRLALADTAVRAMVLPHPAAMVSKLDMVVLHRDITADLATTTTTSTISMVVVIQAATKAATAEANTVSNIHHLPSKVVTVDRQAEVMAAKVVFHLHHGIESSPLLFNTLPYVQVSSTDQSCEKNDSYDQA